MKNSIITIRGFFLLLGFCCSFIVGNSQDLKLTRREKKEIKKAEKLAAFEALGTKLETRQFVIESYGEKVYNIIQVNGSMIFVRCQDPKDNASRVSQGIDDEIITYHTPPEGFFFEGDIQKWELTKHIKNQNYSIKFKVFTGEKTQTTYDIFMNIDPVNASIEIRDMRGKVVYKNYSGKLRKS